MGLISIEVDMAPPSDRARGRAETRPNRFILSTVGPDGRLQSVREIASLVYSVGDLGTIFDQIAAAVCHRTLWARSGIMAVDRTSGYSVLVTRFDPAAEDDPSLPRQWALSTSPALRVAETKQPVVIEDAQHCEEFPGYREDAIVRGYHTVVILPLGCADMQGRDLVLAVSSRRHVSVSDEELDFLMTICHLAALAVDKAKSLHAARGLSARLERALELNSSLLERVLAGDSLQTIAGMIDAVLPDPLVILDFIGDSAHVGRSPDPDGFSDRAWNALVHGAAAKPIAALVQRTEPSDFRQLTRVDLAEAGVAFRRDAYVEPLRVDHERVGALIVFPRRDRLDDFDVLIAQEAKFALSVQLMRAHIQQRQQASELADLFERLFDGAWSDPRQIRRHAERLGLDLSVPAQILAIDLRLEAVRAEATDLAALRRDIARVAQQHRPKSVATEQGNALIVYLPDPPPSAEKVAATVGRQLIDALNWHRTPASVVALGPVCRRLEDYRSARDHCARLLTLAQMFERTGIVRQQDFGPFAMLLSALDSHAVQSFLDETVGRLAIYNREHGGRLLQTASAFIDQGCRYQASAEMLAIHVSTVRYRLRRLHELFGLDLENAETRFALALALRLRSMVGSAAREG
jgi:purine catabolism regulator